MSISGIVTRTVLDLGSAFYAAAPAEGPAAGPCLVVPATSLDTLAAPFAAATTVGQALDALRQTIVDAAAGMSSAPSGTDNLVNALSGLSEDTEGLSRASGGEVSVAAQDFSVLTDNGAAAIFQQVAAFYDGSGRNDVAAHLRAVAGSVIGLSDQKAAPVSANDVSFDLAA